MKKTLILLAALALSTAGTSFAQTAPAKTAAVKKKVKKSPAQKADGKARKMAQELGLNADQEARVEQLMLARHQETAAFKAKYGTDKQAGRPEMKAAHERYQTQLKAILTAEQYAKLNQLKEQQRGQSKAKDGGKGKLKAKA